MVRSRRSLGAIVLASVAIGGVAVSAALAASHAAGARSAAGPAATKKVRCIMQTKAQAIDNKSGTLTVDLKGSNGAYSCSGVITGTWKGRLGPATLKLGHVTSPVRGTFNAPLTSTHFSGSIAISFTNGSSGTGANSVNGGPGTVCYWTYGPHSYINPTPPPTWVTVTGPYVVCISPMVGSFVGLA
jgi:hypothetical protein